MSERNGKVEVKNIMQMVEPMTNGFYAAKGIARPVEAVELTDHYKRFLWDNVYSELGEMYLYPEKWQTVDAIVDIAIYTIDVCLRNGFDKHYTPLGNPQPVKFVRQWFQEYIDLYLKKVLSGEAVVVQVEGCIEILHACEQALLGLGYPLEPFIELVANYNNSKLVDGVAILNASDKIMKPDGWVAPDRDIQKLMEKFDA